MIDELVKLREFMNNNKENYMNIINQRNKKLKTKDTESNIIDLND